MTVPGVVSQQYAVIQPYVKAVGERVEPIVREFCNQQQFAYVSRFKELASVAEKIETGRLAKWSDLEDLFACTVIITTLEDEKSVIDFLQGEFEQVELKQKGKMKKAPDAFRFDSTRFIGRLRGTNFPHLDPEIGKVLFEVQIRTAFEHAWAVTTHALAYKAPGVKWNVLRLQAQLRASVEQLDMLVLGFEESAEHISSHSWTAIDAQMLISEFFKTRMISKSLPSELAPNAWSRFGQNLFELIHANASREDMRSTARTESALVIIRRALDAMKPQAIPRSLSLLQLSFGILAEAGFLAPPLRNYTPLITDELVSLYPNATVFGRGFETNR